MATQAQATANLANAQFSTGPRTGEGKKVSSRNAVTHGLFSQMIVLKDENQAEFDAFREGIFRNLEPANLFESTLVDEIINALWRIRRIDRLADKAMLEDEPDLKRLNFYSLHAGRLRRGLIASMTLLDKAKDAQAKVEKAQLPDAVLIRKADLMANRPTNLEEFGFDLSLAHVDQVIHRENAAKAAARIVNPGPVRRAA